MNRNGIGFLEIVFVIVILGLLAGIAVPRFSVTRNDTQVAIARSDLSNVLKTLPAFVFAGNMEVMTKYPPIGYKSWGEYLLEISSLDRKRWIATTNGLQVISNSKDANQKAQVCNGEYLYIDTKVGKLYFIPENIEKKITFCRMWAESYKDGNVTINLTTSSTLVM